MRTMGGASRTVSFLCDAAGNRTQVTHPDNIRFDTNYDARHRTLAYEEFDRLHQPGKSSFSGVAASASRAGSIAAPASTNFLPCT